jgi:hypothetical protein
MEQKDKYYKEIQKKFDTEDENQIINTLKEIRVTGKALIIPLILEILEQDRNETITQEILSILGQLKDKNSVGYIVKALENNDIKKYRKEIITTCWQSGLDYSKHIELFAKEFISGDYITAIESFTVIEEWIFEADKQTIINCKEYLVGSISEVRDDKKPLYVELVKLVEGYL